METNKLKTKVMRRVYMITYLRRGLSPFALKCYASLALLWGVGRVVCVARVIENAPGLAHPMLNLSFFTNAFTHTHLVVQGLSLAILAFGIFLVRDLFSSQRNRYLLASF